MAAQESLDNGVGRYEGVGTKGKELPQCILGKKDCLGIAILLVFGTQGRVHACNRRLLRPNNRLAVVM